MSFTVVIEAKVRDEAEFLRVARALKEATQGEPDTLRYDWFVTQKPGVYSIIEEYTDADAAEAHNHHVEPLLLALFAVVEFESVNLFGELNEYVRKWAESREGISVHRPL